MVRVSRVLAVTALLMAVSAPASASALTDAPSYGVQAWVGGDPTNPGHVLLIASAMVPTSTPLPVTVSIPVPDGVEVTWAGEIVGADATSDITREGTITAGTGGRAYTFTLEQSHDAQIEGLWKQLEAKDGSALGATLRWVQTVPAEIVSFSIRTPAGAESVRIEPPSNDAPQENSAGERLYTLPNKDLAPGEAHTLDVRFVPAGSAPAGSSGVGVSPLIAVLGGAVLLLAVAIAVLVRRERAGAGSDA